MVYNSFNSSRNLNDIVSEIEKIYRWNCLKSVEIEKIEAFYKWTTLYSILSGTGIDGYSFSNGLRDPRAIEHVPTIRPME